MNIQERTKATTEQLRQTVEQYNKNAEIQENLKRQIIELQGALKVLGELSEETTPTEEEDNG